MAHPPKDPPPPPPPPPGPAAVDEARQRFAASGIHLPPVPAALIPRFMRLGDRFYGTRTGDPPPYHGDCLQDLTELGLAIDPIPPDSPWWSKFPPRPPEEYLLLAVSGHGVNSYEVSYYLVHGPLALFLSIPWGGAYMDEARATAEVNDVLALAAELTRLTTEQVFLARRAPGTPRLVVVGETVGESWWSPSGPEGARSPVQRRGWSAKPHEVLRAAIAWASSEGDTEIE